MIKANELRIGNWFNEFGYQVQATWSTLKTLQETKSEVQLWCKPILLTPEILKKAGFENDYDCEDYWYHEKMRTFAAEKFHIYLPYKVWDSMAPCGYVHQLQNLYFALTGEELEINLLADSSTTVSVGKKLKETDDE